MTYFSFPKFYIPDSDYYKTSSRCASHRRPDTCIPPNKTGPRLSPKLPHTKRSIVARTRPNDATARPTERAPLSISSIVYTLPSTLPGSLPAYPLSSKMFRSMSFGTGPSAVTAVFFCLS
mmetsp:Transcript_30554/g.69006  ORF Transcript_30554/g.69006 Transcript_30554/m.69006 type:complete len:120 (+) Transcript_30554:26-385(+)